MFSLDSDRLDTWYVVKPTEELIMAAEDKRQDLHDKRQEMREIKEELHADETARGDKQALKARRKQVREEMRRLKSELGETGE